MAGHVIFSRSESLLGHHISCQATMLDEGLHVLLTGGSRSHIGAVSTCLPGEEPVTNLLPGHKEHFISGPWAKALADKLNAPACVVCGIHYDNATREDIQAVMSLTRAFLEQLLRKL